MINDHKKGTNVQIAKITIEITIPPPEPKTCLNIAPACPSMAATSNCNNTNIRERPIGLTAATVAMMPSIG